MSQMIAYERIQDPLVFCTEIGKSIAHSGFFGCENVDQGRVMAMECLARGVPPMSLAERYHLIHGRLSMKAEAMLADFRSKAGGTYKIMQRSADGAAIALTRGDQTEIFSLTWSEAQQEPFVYRGKEDQVVTMLAAGQTPPVKAKYATPRSRMQMLWARVVSDGVRAMAPEVVAGSYTPEEISDFDDLPHGGNGAPPAPDSDADDADVVEAEYDVQPHHPPTSDVEPREPLGDGYATSEQVTRILQLYVDLGVPYDKQQEILQKRNAQSLRNLTSDQAAELLSKLESKVHQPEPPVETGSERTDSTSEPCTSDQVDRIKALLAEAKQQPGLEDIVDRVKQKLHSAGLQKLADLSMHDADVLLQSISAKNLEAFIQSTLQVPPGNG